jgi:hypothetical protein
LQGRKDDSIKAMYWAVVHETNPELSGREVLNRARKVHFDSTSLHNINQRQLTEWNWWVWDILIRSLFLWFRFAIQFNYS